MLEIICTVIANCPQKLVDQDGAKMTQFLLPHFSCNRWKRTKQLDIFICV